MTTAVDQPVKLNTATLGEISGVVEVPGYDRAGITTGIVHFGVGGFHRAHQAMYVDRLLDLGEARDWGICGVGVLAVGSKMRDVMAGAGLPLHPVRDRLRRLVDARVIGSIVDYLYAPDDPEAVVEKLAAPATRIVSLTVTEGGYNFSATTGEFDAGNPAIVADLQPGAAPATTFGLVAEALPAGATADSHRPRSCLATTLRATATSPGRRSPRSRGCATRTSATGSTPRAPSRTRWWTASPRSPRPVHRRGSATLCDRRRLARDHRAVHPVGLEDRFAVRSAGPSSRSGCRWSATSNPTN